MLDPDQDARTSIGWTLIPMEGVRIDAHERVYWFKELVPLYGENFTSRLGEAWGTANQGNRSNTVGKRWVTLKRFLVLVAGEAAVNLGGKCHQLVEHLQADAYTAPSEALLTRAVNIITSKIRDKSNNTAISTDNDRTRDNFLHTLNAALRTLTKTSFFPEIDGIRGLGRPRRKSSALTLGELTTNDRPRATLPSALSLSEHSDAILTLSEARLKALKACLSTELNHEYSLFKYGRNTIDNDSLPSIKEITDALTNIRRCSWQERSLLISGRIKSTFGDHVTPLQIAIRLIALKYNGRFFARDLPTSEYSLINICGGSLNVVRHLEATKISTNAAFAIVLCETGFNVSTLQNLRANPYVGKARRGKQWIATLGARKPRARGQMNIATVRAHNIDDEFEIHEDVETHVGYSFYRSVAALQITKENNEISALQALQIYQEMAAPLRKRALEQGDLFTLERFWLAPRGRAANGGTVTSNIEHAGLHWWPEFIARHRDHPIIGGLPITRRMMRRTIFQVRMGNGSMDLPALQSSAGHRGSAQTLAYIDASWIRNRFSQLMRGFQELFEAAFIATMSSAQITRLGGSDAVNRDRSQRAYESGFDFICTNTPAELLSTSYSRGPTCTPLVPCEDCPFRRFTPSDVNFRSLYLMDTALKRAEGHFIIANPARWAHIWLPWRAVTAAYANKIYKSPFKKQYIRAATEIDQQLEVGHLALPLIY